MTKEKLKPLLPYLGVSIIVIALILFRINRDDTFTLLLHSLLVAFGYIATVTDIKSKVIPNQLIIAMFAAWILVVVPQLFFDIDITWLYLQDALLGLAIGGGLSLLVYFMSRKGLGGGDVKFLAGAGIYLGMSNILTAMLFGSILAGLTGLILILIKKIKRKDSIPLTPFLYVGILITVFLL